ncbi:hypothetical protein GLOIN_2v1489035 [Rhizophagus clarus]|uniref:Uncharacterized protein n=1 Tax=Rhizophagus clarus TaxID=94130 RepID=A0A8H3LCT0_9GLOM|nr:hypothetical protein GLOIN_2v1489035 [Rhizophagus clarus]
MTCKARKINKLFGYEYDPVTLKKNKGIPGYMVQRVTSSTDRISRLTNPQIEYIIEQVKSKTTTSPVNKISESMATTSTHDLVVFNETHSNTDDSSSACPKKILPEVNSLTSFILADKEEYLKMLMGSLDDETAYWGTPYEARIEKENKTSSSEEGESNENDNDSDSDTNKSDSNVYFKSDDSDSDDEYDHELHERIQLEEMARLAKLEEKTPTEPANDDLHKILMKIHKNCDIYFDDPVPLNHSQVKQYSGGINGMMICNA